jgi:hypothetical protein
MNTFHETVSPRSKSCIVACFECAYESKYYAEECLNSNEGQLLKDCIELQYNCASICLIALEAIEGRSYYAPDICKLCEDTCLACAAECEKHNHNTNCRKCAEACRKCAAECAKMAGISKNENAFIIDHPGNFHFQNIYN